MDISRDLALGKPVVCPAIIGRAFEVESLRLLMTSPDMRREPVVLISGEAGIGKSRLVDETVAYARANGYIILQGQCFASDTASPFAPVVDLLRTHVTHLSADKRATALAFVPSNVRPLLPDFSPPLRTTDATPLDAGQERRRLFNGLVRVLLGWSANQPALMVVEDAHWSDDATLDFLHYLAHQCVVGTSPAVERPALLLLVTYRSTEVGPALGHFLSKLDRERLACEIAVGPLSRTDVGRMLEAIFALDRPAPAWFLDELYCLTEGYPFFVEEMLKSLVTVGSISPREGHWEFPPLTGARLPRSVRDTVLARLGGLSTETVQLLTLAAVAGRHFDFALLEQLTSWDEPQLIEHLKALVAAQFVVEESSDRFVFRHALIRQAIYANLLGRERLTFHRTIADALERQSEAPSDAHAAELARHTFAGGDWDRALRYGIQAGKRAEAFHAPRAVIEHLSDALEAARQLGRQPDPELLRTRGRAYELLGDFAAAHADEEAALAAARAAGDTPAEWQVLLDLGSLWSGRDYARTGQYFRQAYQLAKREGDRPMLASSLNRLGNWHLNRERPRQAMRRHRAALAALEGTDDRRGLADTLDLLGLAAYLSGDLGDSVSRYDQVVAIAAELDDRPLQSTGLAMRMLCAGCYNTGTVWAPSRARAEGLRDGEYAIKIAQAIDHRAGEAFALISLAIWLGPRGEYARALDAAVDGLAIAREIEHREWWSSAHWALGSIYLDMLAFQEAKDHLERGLALAREASSQIWLHFLVAKLVELYAALGNTQAAKALLAREQAAATGMATLGQRFVWLSCARLALAEHDPAQALQILNQLAASAARSIASAPIPHLAFLRAQALLALGDHERALSDLSAARAAALEQDLPSLLWRIDAAHARVFALLGCDDDAQQAAAQASGGIEAVARLMPDDSLRQAFVQRAQQSLPVPKAPSPQRRTRREADQLTAREREVAALVARGYSNRAIAETLVVSERTTETHVRNILSKLGFTSRTQIAAWAVRDGIATSG